MTDLDTLCRKWRIAKAPPADERRALVERIAASELFRKAPQQREILLYVAARTLTDASSAVSEHEIGSIALGRGADFDPGRDNIVRAQMRHLRQRLEEYFAGPGAGENLVLTIPKGCYAAAFAQRPLPAPAETAPRPAGRRPWRRLAWWRSAVALLPAAVLGSILLWRTPHAAPVSLPGDYGIYRDVFGGAGKTPDLRIVLGNPVVMLYAGSPSPTGKEIGASDAIPVPLKLAGVLSRAANRADRVMPHHLIQIKTHDYTGLGDALACFRLGRLLRELGLPAELTQARFVNWDSVRRQDLIIIGSPHTHDWADRNVPRHSFAIVKMGIENRAPRAGEPAMYPCEWDSTGYPVTDHALIWAWKTAPGSRVLVLAGPSSAATGAAATVFTDPAQFGPIHARLRAESSGGEFPSDWQVLLRVDVRDNIAVRASYVTHRVYRSEL